MDHQQRFFPKPGYIAQIYGYGRVSSKQQFEKESSITDQEARIKAYIEMCKLQPDHPFATAQYAGIISEPHAVSAFRKEFRARPAGSELIAKMKPSDHLVIDQLDRLSRSMLDFLQLNRHMAERGQRLHIVSHFGSSIDTGTASGWYMLSSFALMAEFDSRLKGERIRQARAHARARGTHAGSLPPWFCRVIDCKEGKRYGGRLVFEDWAKPLYSEIKACIEAKTGLIKLVKRKFGSKGKIKILEGLRRFHGLYWFFEAWYAAGCPDINTLKFGEFANEYKRRKKGEGGGPDHGEA